MSRSRLSEPRPPSGLSLPATALASLFLALWLLGAVSPARAGCEEVSPLSGIPGDGTCSGILLDGPPQLCDTPEELMAVIDGGAFLYLQYGFVSAAFQNYSGEIEGQTVQGTLSIFNLGTEANALALYNDPASGSGSPVPEWTCSGEARVQDYFGSVYLQFREGCFFCSLVLHPVDLTALPVLRCLGEQSCGLLSPPVPVSSSSWGRIKAVYR